MNRKPVIGCSKLKLDFKQILKCTYLRAGVLILPFMIFDGKGNI